MLNVLSRYSTSPSATGVGAAPVAASGAGVDGVGVGAGLSNRHWTELKLEITPCQPLLTHRLLTHTG
jgi:hypothetical protein